MQNNDDLNRFLSELNIKESLSVEEDLGNGYVRLKISEAERRQALQDINGVEDIIVELLRNSRDAECKNIFIGTKKIEDKRRIIHFIDDGIGIPPGLKDLIFEARVTSKLENGLKDAYGFHGRGMALFSIKLNVDDIRITFSDKSKGSAIYLDVGLSRVPEKKDQSLMPQIIKMDGDINIIGGVNNILKTIIEFQMQSRHINIYYGTPTAVLATMRELLKHRKVIYPKFDQWEKLQKFIDSNKIKVTEIPMLTDNYNLMEQIALNIFNMNISQRGIQRIIYNEVNPLEPLKIETAQINYRSEGGGGNKAGEDEVEGMDISEKRAKKLTLYDESRLASRFKDDEIRCIIDEVKNQINQLGSKYFIRTGKKIEYKKYNNTIRFTVELEQKD